MRLETPTDFLYERGIDLPVQPENLVGGISINNPRSPVCKNKIDWNHDIEMRSVIEDATASATAHYHYQKISNLLLCDRIIINGQNVPKPLRRVAELLGRRNAQEIKGWSRYIAKRGGAGSICQEQQEYYRRLFTINDALTVLLGIQTINIDADVSYEELKQGADPIFQKLAAKFTAGNQGAYPEIQGCFQASVYSLSVKNRRQLVKHLAEQIDLCQTINQKRDNDIFEPLGSNASRSVRRAGERITSFYNEIGLAIDFF